MKSIGFFGLVVSGTLFLSGCFMSESSLIGPEDAVLPVDGPIVACIDRDPCLTLNLRGDGYFAVSPDDNNETISIRFTPFAQAGGRQVFIAEAELKESDETAFIYGLMRRKAEPDARGATIEIAPIDCAEMSSDDETAFMEAGGMVEPGKIKSCMPVSLDHLKSAMLAMHAGDIADDAWWAERAEDL